MIATEYCKKVFDGTHDSPKPVENGRLLITSKHIANRSLDISSAYLISEEDFENANKRSQVHQWDILFSMIGTVGNVYIETSEKIDYAIKNMGVFSCQNKGKAYWLYYYLQSPLVQAKIDALMAGAVQKFVPLGFLRDLDIPEYTENSKKVVQVLSALDDKIALNKKMNQKLEAMAKRLYDYWFVQYDFPDKNGHPYKTTGGPMTYNPTLKREIPAGWEVGSFGDCIQLVSNRVDPRDVKKDDFYTPIEVIPKRQMSLDECAPIEDATSGLCSYDKKDILLSNRRVYFHKVCIAPFSGLTRDTVIIFRPKTMENLGFVYQVVNSDHFIEYATVNSYGSEQPVLSWPTVQNYKIVKPPQKIMLEYSERVKDIIDHVLNIQLENIKLKNMRDKLLPLLMNGQVVVG